MATTEFHLALVVASAHSRSDPAGSATAPMMITVGPARLRATVVVRRWLGNCLQTRPMHSLKRSSYSGAGRFPDDAPRFEQSVLALRGRHRHAPALDPRHLPTARCSWLRRSC